MKTACLFAAAALAGAVAPPRISLNLEGMAQTYKLANTISRTHDLAYENQVHKSAAEAVLSKQDWTEKCPAGASNAVNCPSPVAKAYDHFDGTAVDVKTRIFLVDVDGAATTEQNCGAPTASTCAVKVTEGGEKVCTKQPLFSKNEKCTASAHSCCVTAVNYDVRSTYLFKYDAQDKAGNFAEQVVFALILDDTTAPVFDQEGGNAYSGSTIVHASAITVEAVSDWRLGKFSATDNIDCAECITDNIKYDIKYLGRDNSVFGKTANQWHAHSHDAVDWSGNSIEQQDYTTAKAYFNSACNGAQFNRNKFEARKGQTNLNSPNTDGCGAKRVGKFLVTGTTHDHAGVYGHNAADNTAQIQTAILVQDTTAPTIYLEGHGTVFQECNKDKYTDNKDSETRSGYVETGALCHDRLDTDALFQHLLTYVQVVGQSKDSYTSCDNSNDSTQIGCEISDTNSKKVQESHFVDIANMLRTVDGPNSKTRTLEYQCKDFALNDAAAVTRTVTTVDTIKPTLVLEGEGQIVQYSIKQCATEAKVGSDGKSICESDDHMTHKSLNDANVNLSKDNAAHEEIGAQDPGIKLAEDQCDYRKEDMRPDVTLSWGPKRFNARVLGDYVRTYTVSDETGNFNSKFRTFTVIDEDEPIITIQGLDSSDCVASMNKCVYEASRDIEYTDAGATCEDWVDGELSHAVEVSGEVVNYRIPGTYVIEYNCQDLTGNTAVPRQRTVVIKDETKPAITLNGAVVNFIEAGFPYVDAGATATDTLDGDITQYIWTDGDTVNDRRAYYAAHTCSNLPKKAQSGEYYLTTKDSAGKFHRVLVHCTKAGGSAFGFKIMKQATSDQAGVCASIGMKLGWKNTAQKNRIQQLTDSDVFAKLDNNSADFVCRDYNEKADASDLMIDTGIITDELQNAEQGRYVINFRVEDKAGNTQVEVLSRTVIVKDSLPPVVSLSIAQKLASQNTKADKTISDATAIHNHGHEFYMAESNTSANGFIIGAVASAVAGVALLGVSMRKSTSTSVPV